MKLACACSLVIVTLLTVSSVRSTSENYTPYTPQNDEELFDQFFGNLCDKVGLTDMYYQYVLTREISMGEHGRVYAFPPQRCPDGSTFSQEACKCVYHTLQGRSLGNLPSEPQCSVLADISFRPESGSYQSSTYVRVGSNKVSAKLDRMRMNAPQGSTSGVALNFQGIPIAIQSFASNDLIGPWKSQMRVRPSLSRSRSVLMSDDCDANQLDTTNRQEKSFEVVLKNSSSVNVFFRFTNDTYDADCQVSPDSSGWYEIEVVCKKTEISVTVNGYPCATVDTGAALARTDCSMYLGARPKDNSDPFYGLLDYFRFYKNPENCKDA